MKRHATTIVLTVLALAALALVLVVDRGSISTNEHEHRKKNLFDAWRIDDVTAVSIERGGKTARLVRAAENDAGQRPWDVEIDGERHPADEQAADQYLGTLEFATAERRVAAGSVDRKTSELDTPRLRIEVDMGAQHFDLAIGGEAPTPAGAAYAEVKAHGMSVVTKELVAALEADPERLRSRSFVGILSPDVAAVELRGAGGTRKIERAPWKLKTGSGFRLDGGPRVKFSALEKIWGALSDLQAEAFLSVDEAKKVSTHEVELVLVPENKAKKTVRIELGGACPKKPDAIVALRSEGDAAPSSAICAPQSVLESLSIPAAELVDRHLIGASIDEVTEVKLENGGRSIDMARSGAEWHVRAPTDRRVDADVGRTFVGGVLAVEADAILAGGAESTDFSHGSVRIISPVRGYEDAGESERIEELRLGAPDHGKVLVKRVEDGAVLSVPEERMAAFVPSDLALRPKRVFDEPIERFRAITVSGGGREQKVERTAEGGWALVNPKGEGLSADIGLATDVAEVLGALSAQRWVAEKDDGSHGLLPPRLVVEAEIGEKGDGGAPSTLRVEIGAPAGEGSFARTSIDGGIFVAPKTLETVADRWLLDRGAFIVDSTQLASATISSGKKKVELVEKGSSWTLVGAGSFSAADAASIRDALSDMQAEGAVSIGKPVAGQGFEKPVLDIRVTRTNAPPIHVVFGAGDAFHATSIFYARRDGVDATYAVAQSKVRPLLDVLGR